MGLVENIIAVDCGASRVWMMMMIMQEDKVKKYTHKKYEQEEKN